jgi:alpha-amylase
LGWSDRKVVIGEDGFGEFVCGECSVSVFVNEAAEGRELFGKWYLSKCNTLT